jgi:putative transposase
MIKAGYELSVTLQCALLVVPPSSAYARPPGAAEADLPLMRQIGELYLKWPFYGSRRMCDEL